MSFYTVLRLLYSEKNHLNYFKFLTDIGFKDSVSFKLFDCIGMMLLMVLTERHFSHNIKVNMSFFLLHKLFRFLDHFRLEPNFTQQLVYF